jgi:hypothetical protein
MHDGLSSTRTLMERRNMLTNDHIGTTKGRTTAPITISNIGSETTQLRARLVNLDITNDDPVNALLINTMMQCQIDENGYIDWMDDIAEKVQDYRNDYEFLLVRKLSGNVGKYTGVRNGALICSDGNITALNAQETNIYGHRSYCPVMQLIHLDTTKDINIAPAKRKERCGAAEQSDTMIVPAESQDITVIADISKYDCLTRNKKDTRSNGTRTDDVNGDNADGSRGMTTYSPYGLLSKTCNEEVVSIDANKEAYYCAIEEILNRGIMIIDAFMDSVEPTCLD